MEQRYGNIISFGNNSNSSIVIYASTSEPKGYENRVVNNEKTGKGGIENG